MVEAGPHEHLRVALRAMSPLGWLLRAAATAEVSDASASTHCCMTRLSPTLGSTRTQVDAQTQPVHLRHVAPLEHPTPAVLG